MLCYARQNQLLTTRTHRTMSTFIEIAHRRNLIFRTTYWRMNVNAV